MEQPVTVARSGVVYPGESGSADDTSPAAKDEVEKLVQGGGRDKIRCWQNKSLARRADFNSPKNDNADFTGLCYANDAKHEEISAVGAVYL